MPDLGGCRPFGGAWCSLEQLPLSHRRRAAPDLPGRTLGGGAQVGRCQDLDTALNDTWRVASRPGLPGYGLCSGEPRSRADPDGCFSVRLLFQTALAVWWSFRVWDTDVPQLSTGEEGAWSQLLVGHSRPASFPGSLLQLLLALGKPELLRGEIR